MPRFTKAELLEVIEVCEALLSHLEMEKVGHQSSHPRERAQLRPTVLRFLDADPKHYRALRRIGDLFAPGEGYPRFDDAVRAGIVHAREELLSLELGDGGLSP